MSNITKELFEKETGLKLGYNYNGINTKQNSYYEISGKSYSRILSKIKAFNNKHNSNVFCHNDYIKDVTTIIL